jgi:hypothetical protein
MSIEVEETEIIKQVVGVCLLGQRWNSACRLPGKGCNIRAKYALRCTSRQTEAATGLQTSRQAFERNLVSHQKFAYLHFEVLKLPVCSPDLVPSDYYLFPNLKKHLKGGKFSSTEEATLAADGWFAAQAK